MPEAHQAFVGSVPANYDRYLGPLIFEDYARDLAERIARADPRALLETAAGTGIVTRHLRRLLGDTIALTVTDLNPDMLAYAQQQLGPLSNARFETADAQALPLPDAAFDALACQFGFMFFPDKAKAFAEAARVLRPGGLLVFNVWDSLEHNHLVDTVVGALTELLGDGPPRFFATPFGWYALDPMKALLEDAGFDELGFAVLPRPCVAASAEAVARGFIQGSPFAAELGQRSPVPVEEAVARVTRAVAAAHGEPPRGTRMQAITVTARRA